MTQTLAELQKAFVRAVVRPADAAADENDARLAALIVASDAMGVEERLAVHRDNTRFALVRALEQIYAVCARILGKDYFRQIARAYIARFPSADADLNGYGERLAEFFAESTRTRPELADFAYLPDLARLEYAYHAAYYAADPRPFDHDAFARCTNQAAIRFTLPAATALLRSDHPVLAIWEANRRETKADTVVADGCNRLCVRRVGDKPQIDRVNEARFALLTAIAEGQTLGELAEMFADLDAELPALIRDGWLGEFKTADQVA